MISCEIREVRGPSIFSAEPCLCLTIAFNELDRNLLKQHEQQAMMAFDAMVKQMGFASWRESFASGDECFLVFAVAEVAAFLHKKVDAYEGGPWISKDLQGNVMHIAFPDFHQKTAQRALKQSLRIVANMYPRKLAMLFPRWVSVGESSKAYARFLKRGVVGKKHRLIREVQLSLNRRKVPWFHLDRYSNSKNFIQVGFGRFQHLLERTTSFESSLIGITISMDKSATRDFLADLGFPVTKQFMAADADSAVNAAESLGYPVVVKPVGGAHGFNVHVNLRNEAEVRVAFSMILKSGQRSGRLHSVVIIVEGYVVGSDYRISIVGGQLLEAYRRIPAQVTGDGESSVAELVELENKSPLRGEKQSAETTYIRLELNEQELVVLKKQELSVGSVPAAGQVVLLRENANWSSGGSFEDVIPIIHPDNIALAARIAAAMNIDIIGVDVIVNDISESFLEGGLRVIEVNHNPDIFGTNDELGNFDERGGPMIDLLAPLAIKQWVPVIVVAESETSLKLTELLGLMLMREGLAPGVVNKSGMSVKGELWSNPQSLDYSDPALPLLRNKEIDAAIIEQSYRTLLDNGVGTGGCDIGVVLSIPDNNMITDVWRDGMAASKAAEMLLMMSRKASVVCIDDPNAALCVEKVSSSSLCVLSLDQQSVNLDDAITRGAKAVVLESMGDDGIHVRIVDPNLDSKNNGKGFHICVRSADKKSALTVMAVLGVYICLGYSLESCVAQLEKIEGNV